MIKHQPGTRAPVAHCLDCGEWTVWAKDGTAILRHKPGCPQLADDGPAYEDDSWNMQGLS